MDELVRKMADETKIKKSGGTFYISKEVRERAERRKRE